MGMCITALSFMKYFVSDVAVRQGPKVRIFRAVPNIRREYACMICNVHAQFIYACRKLLQMPPKVCHVRTIMAVSISDQFGVGSMQVLIPKSQQLHAFSAAVYCSI